VANEVMDHQNKITRAAQIDPFSEKTTQRQKDLLWSDASRLLAVRSVLTARGRNTPGPDGVVLTNDDYDAIMRTLGNFRSYKCGKVKRVWIPKAGLRVINTRKSLL